MDVLVHFCFCFFGIRNEQFNVTNALPEPFHAKDYSSKRITLLQKLWPPFREQLVTKMVPLSECRLTAK